MNAPQNMPPDVSHLSSSNKETIVVTVHGDAQWWCHVVV